MLHMKAIRSPDGMTKILSVNVGLNANELNPTLATVSGTAEAGRDAYVQYVFASSYANY